MGSLEENLKENCKYDPLRKDIKQIGFIGQGFVGKNLAENFIARGYTDIIRYDLDKFKDFKFKIKECDLVFVSVPTPSTPKGFDSSILYDVIPLTSPGTIVVIKSTIPPEVARELSDFFFDRTIMLCPEFLTEATAAHDTAHPDRNIIGVSITSANIITKAESVMRLLPEAPYSAICTYEEASLVKYAGNCFFVVKNMFFNILYDLAMAYGADWNLLQEMITMDKRIHPVHTEPFHKGGRGAGGHCLIKDFAQFKRMVDKHLRRDKRSRKIIKNNAEKNIKLLSDSEKDLDLLDGVYGTHKSFWANKLRKSP